MPTERGVTHGQLTAASNVLAFPPGTAVGDLLVLAWGSDFRRTGALTGWTIPFDDYVNYFNGSLAWKIATSADVSAGSVTLGLSGAANGSYTVVGIQAGTFDANAPLGVAAHTIKATSSATLPQAMDTFTSLASSRAYYFASRSASGQTLTCSTGSMVWQHTASGTANGYANVGALYAEDVATSASVTPSWSGAPTVTSTDGGAYIAWQVRSAYAGPGFASEIAGSLLAWWKLDESSGTVAADSSGNGRHATYGSGTSLSQPTVRAGGSAAARNASGALATVASSSWMDQATFSVSAWIRWTGTGTNAGFVGRYDASTVGSWLLWNSAAGGVFDWLIRSSGGDRTIVGPVGAGENRFMVLTYDGTTLRGYLDGGLVGTFAVTLTPVAGAVGIGIGAYNAAGANPSGAVLQDVTLHSGALSAARVATIYQAGMVPPPPATPTATGSAPVSVGSSSVASTTVTTTGSAPINVGSSSVTSTVGVVPVTTGTAPVNVESSSAAAIVTATPVLAGTAPVGVATSSAAATVGIASVTGTAPIAVGSSSAIVGISVVGPWTPDPTGQAVLPLDIPDAVIRLDPILAVPPAGFPERAISMQVQAMPTLVKGSDGRYHSDGTYPITRTVLGVPHLFVDGIDVTYLRGIPSRIHEFSLVEPGGEELASISFPQVMPFETTGEAGSELYWLGWDRDCEIAIVEADGTRHYVWSGVLVSDELRLTATNAETTWHARGLLYGAAAAVKHRPPTWMPPTDIGTVIPDILNAVPSRRYAPIPRVPTGIPTTDRGSSQDSVWDHVQKLLATAWTADGHQWTIQRVDRGEYRMVLKDDTVVYTLETGTPGVEHTLTRDRTQAPNIIWGRGVGPDGYGWGRWFYPNLDFGAGIDAAYLDGAYRLPVAADPKVQPGHPEHDPKVAPVEIEIDFGSGTTLDEAIRSAELQLSRDENAGMTGDITVRTDPAEGSRILWQPGQTLEYRNLRGGDYSTGFQEWRLRPSRVQVDLMGDGIPVTLTVDSKARDAMTLTSILKRDRSATIDPARRPGALNRLSRQEQDQIVEYDGEADGGHVPSHYVPARQWVCFWRPISQVNRIVKIEYYSESRFCLALFGGDVTPAHLDRWVGDPLAVKAPFDVNADEVDALGFIEAWGQLDDASGYSPYTETGEKAGPFNGQLLETNAVEYVAYQNLWVKVCEWSADGGVMSGKILPAVNA